MKKRSILSLWLASVCLLLGTLGVLPIHAEAPDSTPPAIDRANAACVYNIENDRVIFGKNAEETIYPASTVKLMTAILAVEAFGDDLDREITVPSAAVAYVQGNNIALKRNEVITVEELLYALICGGANDAANVFAIEIAGGIEEFAVLMNEKAREIGAMNTFYTNPTGIHDPLMTTTAADTAKIAAYAYELDPIADMASVEKRVIEPTNKQKRRTVFNKNYYFSSLIEYKYLWSVPRGMNAGYTAEGGYCIATAAVRDGLTYIVTVMGAEATEESIYSYTHAAELINWALKNWGYVKVLTTSNMICEVPVRLSSKVDYVTLFPSENIELFLPLDVDVASDVVLDWALDVDSFTAPVQEGAVGGHLTVTFDGQNLGTFDLVTRNSVSRNNVLYVLDLLKDMTRTPTFRMIITAAVIAVLAYLVILILLVIIRYRRRMPKRRPAAKRPAISSQTRPSPQGRTQSRPNPQQNFRNRK